MTKLKKALARIASCARILSQTIWSFLPERLAQSLPEAEAQITRFLEFAGFDPTDVEHRNAFFAYAVGLPAGVDYYYPRVARRWVRRQWAQLHLYTASRPAQTPGLKVAPAPVDAAPKG